MIDLRLGDCLEVLKTIPDNSVDSIVTDPPYGISFMNAKWDYDVPSTDVWVECLRVLKPGGHLLSFAGSRTYHRMVVRIEDAGFDIRDQIMWIYGSGFPKSHNILKQIEKQYICQYTNNVKIADNKLKPFNVELIEEKTGSVVELVVIHQEEENWNKIQIGVVVSSSITDMSIFVTKENIEENTSLLLKNLLEEKLKNGNKSITLTELKTIIDLKIFNLLQYQNTLKSIITVNHTALKPAHEPIVVARKPLSKKSVAENVLKWGTGGLNIDVSRIGLTSQKDLDDYRFNMDGNLRTTKKDGEKLGMYDGGWKVEKEQKELPEGRWPANIILDEEAGQILDEQSGITQYNNKRKEGNYKGGHRKEYVGTDDNPIVNKVDGKFFSDKGGASRFFYCPKTSKKDRDEGLDGFEEKQIYTEENGKFGYGNKDGDNFGDRIENVKRRNNHPTVKPTSLMEYLIKLVTPVNGTVMDPFMGSGSTGKASVRGGFDFIGIEREEEYLNIAKARIENESSTD